MIQLTNIKWDITRQNIEDNILSFSDLSEKEYDDLEPFEKKELIDKKYKDIKKKGTKSYYALYNISDMIKTDIDISSIDNTDIIDKYINEHIPYKILQYDIMVNSITIYQNIEYDKHMELQNAFFNYPETVKYLHPDIIYTSNQLALYSKALKELGENIGQTYIGDPQISEAVLFDIIDFGIKYNMDYDDVEDTLWSSGALKSEYNISDLQDLNEDESRQIIEKAEAYMKDDIER